MRIRRSAALLLVGSAFLAACGGGSASDQAKVVASDDTASTATATTSSTTSTTTAPDPAAAISARLATAADSVQDAGSGRFDLSEAISTGGISTTLTGHGEFAAGNVDLSLDLGSFSGLGGEDMPDLGTIEIRQVNGSTYLDMAALSSLVGASDPGWVRLPGDVGAGRAAPKVGGADPTRLLGILNGGTPEVVGTEVIRGVSTTHYRGDFDLQAALQRVPAGQRGQLSGAFGALTSSTIPVDVWIGDDNLVHRLTMALDLNVDGTAGSVTVTMELFDFGAPVTVKAPADYTDADDLGSLLGPLAS